MALLNIGSVSSIVQLRGVKTVPAPEEYKVAFVFGVQDIFTWNDASTETDDGETIVKPNDRTGAGRWLTQAGLGITTGERDEYFGDGSDGPFPGGVVTLTKDTNYTSWTRAPGDQLICGRFIPRFNGVVDLRGAIADTVTRAQVNGNNGAAVATGGAAAVSIQVLGDTLASAASSIVGGAGGTGAGTQADAPLNPGYNMGGAGTDGAAGGAGSGGAGGASRAVGALFPSVRTTQFRRVLAIPPAMMLASASPSTLAAVSGGQTGASGGGGGGDGTAGGGGGSGGLGGVVGWFAAKKLIVDATTAAGCFSFKGGNGGTGGTPAAGNRGGGGAGGAGGGGCFYGLFGSIEGTAATDTVNCDGGNGGSGGNGIGTGIGGSQAAGASGGLITICNLAGTTDATRFIQQVGGVGTAGTGPSGITGGIGGTGGACRATLGAAA